MMNLETLLAIFDALQAQGVYTAAQVTKIKTAARTILSNYTGADDYQIRFNLFLSLLGGKSSI